MKLEAQPRLLAHDGEKDPGCGPDELPALKENLHAFADQQRGDGEVVTAQPECGNADGDGHQHGEHHTDAQADPGRELVSEEQIAGAVSTDSEERGVAERNLTTEACQYVPRLGHQRIHEKNDHDVMQKGRVEHVGKGDQHQRKSPIGCSALKVRRRTQRLRHGQCQRLVVHRGGRLQVRHQKRPNSPLGRNTTTVRYRPKTISSL